MSLNGKMEDDLKDVDLCYKGLGVPFDSPPREVERAYRSLTEKIKKDLLSSDPAIRLKAGEEAELINTLYDKIKNSVNYQRKLREKSHGPGDPEKPRERKTEVNGPKVILTICPSCNNTVSKAFKVCPICKKKIYSSKFEKIWNENMLFIFVTLFCLVLAILIAVNFKEIIKIFS